MKLRCLFNYIILFSLVQSLFLSCSNAQTNSKITLGIEQTKTYLPLLKNKKIGLVSNQTSTLNNEHLVDYLLKENISVKSIFSLEHGFRGDKDAGEKVNSDIDTKTGLQIISLYGKHKKPSVADLKEIDIMVFDIQDVGVRFYTYISSLHYIMEACAENNIQLIVLDKPNPNAFYIDGPVLDTNFNSFIGMHPVPVVYGMTIGEYALMIKGEEWIKKSDQLNLKVISCLNYSHKDIYHLKTPPSPNLPNWESVYLYPSLCFFEGTDISVGRGTSLPFQIFGTPIDSTFGTFSFTPKSNYGSKKPKHKNEMCFGYNIVLPRFSNLFNRNLIYYLES